MHDHEHDHDHDHGEDHDHDETPDLTGHPAADHNPGTHLHLDPVGGAAGDMMIAALLDLRPDLEPEAAALARSLGPGLALVRDEAKDGGLRGSRVRFDLPAPGHGPHHYPDYAALVQRAAPDPGTAARAQDILRRLGEAEARVHGVTLDRVHFHEIADWDSIADILLSALLIERLGVRSASTAPLPLGAGRVRTEHGMMPVPAPATLELLAGLPVTDDGVAGERVTPTGAAILAHIAPTLRLPQGPMTPLAIGYGLGTRRLPGLANMLRATLWASLPADGARIGVVRFAVDDQTGEDLAVGLDRIRAAEGVLDALQLPAFGKKGRMTARIEVLCDPSALDRVARLCLSETATLGVRLSEERRLTLPRRMETRHGIGAKAAVRPDGRQTRKAEMDEIAGAGDRAAREALRRRVESDD